jgi:hypothetical protein
MVLRVRIEWFFVVASVWISYLWFHENRASIENDFVRASFPSFLVPILMLGATELDRSIVFHSVAKKIAITFCASVVMVIWFEGLIPLFWAGSTSSLTDVFAILLGWLAYSFLWIVGRFCKFLCGTSRAGSKLISA